MTTPKLLLTPALLLLTLTPLQLPAQSPAQATIQSTLANDTTNLSKKFTGLAQSMSAKYDWKPGPGVRSVSDVFNLIVMENGMLTRLITGATTPAGPRPAPITDPAKLQEALSSSYAELGKAISSLSDADLQAPVKLFGRDMTKQSALMMMLFDQHEHLGQSIAYARTNNVVPPWSK